MTRIEQIERDISALSPKELEAFRKWFLKFDAEAWDRQIKEDVRAGKLDAMADTAAKAVRSGQCSEL